VIFVIKLNLIRENEAIRQAKRRLGGKMNYKEVRERVDSFTYVPLKAEGGPVHPMGWTYDGTDEQYKAWYERQLNAYIKYAYNVVPTIKGDLSEL